jgi:hypothetical protein
VYVCAHEEPNKKEITMIVVTMREFKRGDLNLKRLGMRVVDEDTLFHRRKAHESHHSQPAEVSGDPQIVVVARDALASPSKKC